jgi:hypothetical protein
MTRLAQPIDLVRKLIPGEHRALSLKLLELAGRIALKKFKTLVWQGS